MASDIFWIVVTVTLRSLVTYCLFNPPRNRIRPVEQGPEGLHRDHQARPGASKFTSKTDTV